MEDDVYNPPCQAQEGRDVRMGHSQEDKAGSHDRIVRAAAARFRESGVDGIGVADLMKNAGLTHGGFYRHFATRDELVAEAVERALHDGGLVVDALANRKRAPLAAVVDGYLSTSHRDDLATSCAVTTLAADVARSSERARSPDAPGVYGDLTGPEQGLFGGPDVPIGHWRELDRISHPLDEPHQMAVTDPVRSSASSESPAFSIGFGASAGGPTAPGDVILRVL